MSLGPLFLCLKWEIHETMSYRGAGSKHFEKILAEKENLNMTMRKTEKPNYQKKPGECERQSLEAFTQVKRVAVRFSPELVCSYMSLLSCLNGLVRSGNMSKDGSMRPFPALSELESRRMQIAACY